MESVKNRIPLIVGIFVFICLLAYFLMSRSAKPHHLELSGGTIYYKGPMKGHGNGKSMGTDDLNPDIIGDEGPSK